MILNKIIVIGLATGIPFSVSAKNVTLKKEVPVKNIKKNDSSLVQFIKANQWDDVPSETNICLYNNGAMVSLLYAYKTLNQNSALTIPWLSTAVQQDSITVRPPENTNLQEYSFVHAEEKASKTEETSCKLIMKAEHVTPPHPDDTWLIQYCANKINWKALHAVEFLDETHIHFSTVLRLSNQTGIPFNKARLRFFDCVLPSQTSEQSSNQEGLMIYDYSRICDLAPYQEKNLIWVQAKRVTITLNNGLFVGGQYLNEMKGIAYPQVENWIVFPNTKAVGLGLPIPSGNVAVFYNSKGFISLVGHTILKQVKPDDSVFMHTPSIGKYAVNTTDDPSYSFITAQLVQENYKHLTPSMVEAEYRLSVQNLRNVPTSLNITLNKNTNQKCSLVRSNVKYETTEQKEIVWKISLPARGVKEIRYKVIIISPV